MRNTFRILFYLKKNAVRRNGEAPVLGRITVDGARAHFSTRLYVAPRQWDSVRNCMKGRSEQAACVNERLRGMRMRIEQAYAELLAERAAVSPERLKEALDRPARSAPALLEFFRRHNEEFGRMVGVSRSRTTYYKYRCVLVHLERFVGERYGADLALEKIDKNFLAEFHAYILQQPRRKKNTVWVYLIAFKHILQQARRQGYRVADIFDNYKVHNEFTPRNYLSIEEIESFMRLRPSHPTLQLVRDAFLFSCFTGLSYIDMKGLGTDNLRYDDRQPWIATTRRKTGSEVALRLFEVPHTILARRIAMTPKAIFDLPSNGWCNDCLRRLARQAGIGKRVTFHTARHTFATTITLSQGMAIETISKLLGHKNIKTTQIYASVTHAHLSGELERLSHRLGRLCGRWKNCTV